MRHTRPLAYPHDPLPSPGWARAWWTATRPWSLPIAIAPVAVGAALGWARTGRLNLWLTLAVLAASVLMQLVTNLQNDVGYTVRGAERDGTRTGPPRATAQGWLSVGTVRAAVIGLSLVAAGLGLALVSVRGWPVLVLGTLSLVAALAYMGGPRPIAYTPWGELTVLVFFGGIAVCGTDWMLSGSVGLATVTASLGCGALAAAVLAANNLRDAAHDVRVGRRTFAVVFGPAAAFALYRGLVGVAFGLLLPTAVLLASPGALLPLVLAPQAWRMVGAVASSPRDARMTPQVLGTVRLALRYALLLVLGTVLGRVAAGLG